MIAPRKRPLLIHTYEQEDKQIMRFYFIKRVLIWSGLVLFSILFWMTLFTTLAKADTIVVKTLKASWYSNASLKKEGTWKNGETLMANGKRFDENALTCASRIYPLGTMVRVKNLANGKSVVCKVTDRIGKRFATTRIDLSKGCFSKIADLKQGVINVTVRKI